MSSSAGAPCYGTSGSPADRSLLGDDSDNAASAGRVVVAVIENRAMEVRHAAAISVEMYKVQQ